jgi:hypothetical protein
MPSLMSRAIVSRVETIDTGSIAESGVPAQPRPKHERQRYTLEGAGNIHRDGKGTAGSINENIVQGTSTIPTKHSLVRRLVGEATNLDTPSTLNTFAKNHNNLFEEDKVRY